MKFSEASRLLEEGKRIRKKSWDECCYIYIGDDGILLDEDGCYFEGYSIIGEWEEYIEAKDTNIHTKIEELWYMGRNEFVNDDNVPDYDKVCNKLNEVIKELNRRNENERI